MGKDWARKLAAEAVGSFLLFAVVVGSGIMGVALGAGNDAVALLGNSLATGAVLYVLIAMLGPLSGAHFNPAVTLAFALKRELPPLLALAYIAVQIIAGIAGVLAVHAMFDQPLIQTSQHVRNGPGQWLGEIIATFALLFTIFGTIRFAPDRVPTSVALVIIAGYWFTSSTSFANPAITIARSLTDSFAGIAPADVPGFIIAQFIGALLALLVAKWLFAEGPAHD